MDEIQKLEQQLEQLKAQANMEIGKLIGKIELLKEQNEKSGDKKTGQALEPDNKK